jgi:hypothetical protein
MKLSRIVFATLVAVPNLVLAQASCPPGTNTFPSSGGNALIAQLTGNMLCAARGGDRWQEFHQSGGALIDFKLGPGHPVDPTEQVGTWTANDAASTVTHNYGAGGVFTWLVCRGGGAGNPNPLTLVSTGAAGTVTGVTLQAGGPSKCP